MRKNIKKVLILGSGALKIGEAGEFDYSGSQAIKALREEGLEVILINPNIATIQTSEKLAHKIYFLPVTPYFVRKVIKKEKPDGILLSFGGQTALNCGVELARRKIFEKYQVRVLGTPIKTIEDTEDRGLFIKRLNEINLKTPFSQTARTVKQAMDAAKKIGYPVLIRSSFSLGGLGSGLANNTKELEELSSRAFANVSQILIEEYLKDWKEVEYEVVRDKDNNCLTVCNMENIDPMGIHTGDSIVVAPSQTLNNEEYHFLRIVSLQCIRHLGIIGECNIQFALNPKSLDYRIIEVNARLSRSSALASKATGYPLAYVAAKLALGYGLPELKNSVTQSTSAFFEPALDYLVLKIPRWDFDKFINVSYEIGSQMKSVGEVMAIGRSFEEVLQKAIRMLQIGLEGVSDGDQLLKNHTLPFNHLDQPTPFRIFAVAQALKKEVKIKTLAAKTGIDSWFLHKIKNIVRIEKKLKSTKFSRLKQDLLLEAKKAGFSDKYLGKIFNYDEQTIREVRLKKKIVPYVKQIDTLAAEFPAKTNYLYLTYHGTKDDLDFKEKKEIVVLGSGVYRIGSSVEFDWCAVNTVWFLKKLGYQTIMINYNPETVSTDYDIGDKLYFDELSLERVLDICEKEKPLGVVVSVGGQTPNNLAMPLSKAGVKIFGTSPCDIDRAEDRYKFSLILDKLGIDQPAWREVRKLAEVKKFAREVGFPLLVRPSYVLSGTAMNVAFDLEELIRYLQQATTLSPDHPVVISKFEDGAKEIDLDGVAQQGQLIVYAISEHVENAGVHSGDATLVFPPQRLYSETTREVIEITKKIANELKITGPFNIQFLARDNAIKVIECNLRASRSFPFVSKVAKINLIELANKAMMGQRLKKDQYLEEFDYVGVKAPQFSFSRLKKADPILRVEMASTGEVAAFGDDLEEAFLKSILAVGFKLPKRNILVSLGGEKNKIKLVDWIKKLKQRNFKIYATRHTAEFLKNHGIPACLLHKIYENKRPNILNFLKERKLDLVINITDHNFRKEIDDDYQIRRLSIDYNIPLITNAPLARLFIDALIKKEMGDLKIKEWGEY